MLLYKCLLLYNNVLFAVIMLVPKWPFSSTRNKKAHLVFFPRGLAATFNKDIARKVVSLSLSLTNYYVLLLQNVCWNYFWMGHLVFEFFKHHLLGYMPKFSKSLLVMSALPPPVIQKHVFIPVWEWIYTSYSSVTTLGKVLPILRGNDVHTKIIQLYRNCYFFCYAKHLCMCTV